MELPLPPIMGFNPLDPVVSFMKLILHGINGAVHSYGWSLVLLAAAVKLFLWPLNTLQFKAALKTQQLMPKVKALQAKYKNDKERLNAEMMAMYSAEGTNPLAGCFPLIVQLPILWSLYYVITSDRASFAHASWLWIGSAFARGIPGHFLAANLATIDYLLLGVYAISMYFNIRLTSPAVDPQQAQQQKIMAFVSPVMVASFGLRASWPSALLVYWLSYNVFSMAQQLFLINKYHRNPSPIGPHPEATDGARALAGGGDGAKPGKQSVATAGANITAKAITSSGGSRAARRRRSSRR